MPNWWPLVLLFVFSTHMPYFAWRWRRERELRHAATTLTFSLLIVVYALRVFAPGLAVGSTALWRIVRVPAWVAAALSIGLLLRHLAGARRRSA